MKIFNRIQTWINSATMNKAKICSYPVYLSCCWNLLSSSLLKVIKFLSKFHNSSLKGSSKLWFSSIESKANSVEARAVSYLVNIYIRIEIPDRTQHAITADAVAHENFWKAAAFRYVSFIQRNCNSGFCLFCENPQPRLVLVMALNFEISVLICYIHSTNQ